MNTSADGLHQGAKEKEEVSDGGVTCWGLRNTEGFLGQNSSPSVSQGLNPPHTQRRALPLSSLAPWPPSPHAFTNE